MTAPTTTIPLRPAGREGEAGRRVVEAYERLLQSGAVLIYGAARAMAGAQPRWLMAGCIRGT